MAEVIQRVKNSLRNVASKQAKQQAKQARQARQQEAMNSWSTSCEECDAPLVAHNAFFTIAARGLGVKHALKLMSISVA